MKVLSVLLVSIAVVHLSNGQVPFLGSCPNIQPAAITLPRLAGNWFEAERSTLILPEVGLSCIQATYAVNPNQNQLDVQIRFTELNRNQKVLSGRLVPLSNPIDGRLQLTIDDFPPFSAIPMPTWKVDYPATVVFLSAANDIMIKFACTNVKFFNFQSVWVLVKDRTFPDAIRNQVRTALAQLSLSPAFLKRTDRNCPTTLNGRTELLENEIVPNGTNATLFA